MKQFSKTIMLLLSLLGLKIWGAQVQYEVLTSFALTNGSRPGGDLVLGKDGNFYGTTASGGESNLGTVFQVTPDGGFHPLASFSGTNGANPQAGLCIGNDDYLYGTTYFGGISNKGTVFRISTNGQITSLSSFVGTNGANPQAALALGTDGNFYGTTFIGGNNGRGTVFRVTPGGALTNLVLFASNNGAYPQARLLTAGDGNLYGTTASGGTSDRGTVFRVTPAGSLTTLLSFGGTNGGSPQAGLALGNDGALYGTTYSGGGGINGGTIFRITTNGTFTLVSSFNFNPCNPQSGLTLAEDGSFYGTTYGQLGNIFQVTTNGVLTTLVTFFGGNGASPTAGLAIGADGRFYGTTSSGGSSNVGVVFRLGIPPSITSQPNGVRATNGTPVTLTATSFGTPLRWQWFTSSGRTATAFAYLSFNQVFVNGVTDGGTAYDSAPTVQFVGGSGVGGSGPSPASGYALVTNGSVTAVIVTNHGYYGSPPEVQIANPPAVLTPIPEQTNAALNLSSITNLTSTNFCVVITNNSGSVTSRMVAVTFFEPPQNFFAEANGTGLRLRLVGTPGYPYVLQSTTNLTAPVTWVSVATDSPDSNGNWQMLDTNLAAPQKFYRALVR